MQYQCLVILGLTALNTHVAVSFSSGGENHVELTAVHRSHSHEQFPQERVPERAHSQERVSERAHSQQRVPERAHSYERAYSLEAHSQDQSPSQEQDPRAHSPEHHTDRQETHITTSSANQAHQHANPQSLSPSDQPAESAESVESAQRAQSSQSAQRVQSAEAAQPRTMSRLQRTRETCRRVMNSPQRKKNMNFVLTCGLLGYVALTAVSALGRVRYDSQVDRLKSSTGWNDLLPQPGDPAFGTGYPHIMDEQYRIVDPAHPWPGKMRAGEAGWHSNKDLHVPETDARDFMPALTWKQSQIGPSMYLPPFLRMKAPFVEPRPLDRNPQFKHDRLTPAQLQASLDSYARQGYAPEQILRAAGTLGVLPDDWCQYNPTSIYCRDNALEFIKPNGVASRKAKRKLLQQGQHLD